MKDPRDLTQDKGSGLKFRIKSFRMVEDAERAVHCRHDPRQVLLSCRKVDVRIYEKGSSNFHGARPLHLTISMITWTRTSRLSIRAGGALPPSHRTDPADVVFVDHFLRLGVYRGTSLIRNTPPPLDHHGTLGIVLLYGPRREAFLMSEVPL